MATHSRQLIGEIACRSSAPTLRNCSLRTNPAQEGLEIANHNEIDAWNLQFLQARSKVRSRPLKAACNQHCPKSHPCRRCLTSERDVQDVAAKQFQGASLLQALAKSQLWLATFITLGPKPDYCGMLER